MQAPRARYIESRAVAHRVTLIPGDGTGPELTEATRRVLEATGVEFEWDVQEAGADTMDRHGGNPLPDEVLESIRRNGTALKGPITTPVGGGFRSVNVGLRKALDLYAQVRPCKSYEGVRSRFDDVDLVIVRENTEDLYAGIEYEQGTPEAEELIAWIESKGGKLRHRDAGISIKPLSVSGTRRIVQFAFDYARRQRPPQGHGGAQGEHHEVHRRPLPARRAARSPRRTATSSSTTASWTTCACSSCSGPRSTTCSCCRTSTATSSPTSRPG